MGLECRPPGLSAQAAGRADPGWTRLSDLTLSSTRCALSRKMWPGSFPRECSRILLSPPFFHSRRCTCQPAPTSPLRVTKDVPTRTRLHWFQRATSPSPRLLHILSHARAHTFTRHTRALMPYDTRVPHMRTHGTLAYMSQSAHLCVYTHIMHTYACAHTTRAGGHHTDAHAHTCTGHKHAHTHTRVHTHALPCTGDPAGPCQLDPLAESTLPLVAIASREVRVGL